MVIKSEHLWLTNQKNLLKKSDFNFENKTKIYSFSLIYLISCQGFEKVYTFTDNWHT